MYFNGHWEGEKREGEESSKRGGWGDLKRDPCYKHVQRAPESQFAGVAQIHVHPKEV